MLIGYVGPEVMLPAASALAAIMGVFMLCGRYIWQFIVRVFRFIFRRPSA